jgi:alkaline phosphatase
MQTINNSYKMKNRIFNVVLIILVLAGVSFGVAALRTEHSDRPKYVFYFIGDGMSFNHILGTEQYNAAKEGKSEVERLNFTKFPVRNFVTNYSTSNLVTDSAAAGTALASGVKTTNAYIGVDAEVTIFVPLQMLHRSLATRWAWLPMWVSTTLRRAASTDTLPTASVFRAL